MSVQFKESHSGSSIQRILTFIIKEFSQSHLRSSNIQDPEKISRTKSSANQGVLYLKQRRYSFVLLYKVWEI